VWTKRNHWRQSVSLLSPSLTNLQHQRFAITWIANNPEASTIAVLFGRNAKLLDGQARDHGCKLIITPLIDLGPVGPLVHGIRIALIGFLESAENGCVNIVLADSFQAGNETILGDVLLARALPPQSNKDYQQTSPAPTVLQAIRAFDEAYRYECQRQASDQTLRPAIPASERSTPFAYVLSNSLFTERDQKLASGYVMRFNATWALVLEERED
jgi:hypothetical protein